jgi:hypothetical protein
MKAVMSACRVASARLLVVTTTVLLIGCAATLREPIERAEPGSARPFAMFQANEAACEALAEARVSEQVRETNQAAVNPADGRSIQARYDAAYARCMIARDDALPAHGPARAAGPASPSAAAPEADRLVLATQMELIRLGYLGGDADGVAGRRTRAAISTWQRAHDWPADGTASLQLLASLQAAPGPAAAPHDWVAPATTSAGASGSPTPAESASGGGMPPAVSPAVAPVSAEAPAAPTWWATPTRSP